MTTHLKDRRRLERNARLLIWLVARSSRNRSLLDRLCRLIVNRATAVKPDADFMRDPLIDNDPGFDPDELDRYQRGQ
jgi:hypothetical protein